MSCDHIWCFKQTEDEGEYYFECVVCFAQKSYKPATTEETNEREKTN